MPKGNGGARNDASGFSAKRYITKLLLVDKVQNKWAKAIVGAISTSVILSLLTLGVATLYQEVGQRVCEARNMSPEQARAVAKQNVGADTVDAIPFRNKDCDLQYIAVSTKTPNSPTEQLSPPPDVWTIHLLECLGFPICRRSPTTMEAHDPMLYSGIETHSKNPDAAVSEEKYRKAIFDVVDIDGDGNKEIFSVVKHYGSGSSFTKIYVYDSLSKDLYWLTVTQEYGNPVFDSEDYSPNFSQNREISTWMYQKVVEPALEPEEGLSPDEGERYDEAVQDWLQTNGRGFYEGKLDIHKFQGEIPDPGSTITCSVDDGEFKWASYFKGAVFGYDKSEGAYFIVYVPYSIYGWVGTIVAGERYLWLDVGTDKGILAFDKEGGALTIVPVPELSSRYGELFMDESTDQSGQTYPERLPLYLRVSDTSLYLSDWEGNPITRLTLPDYVNDENEFEDAAVCVPN